MIVKLHQKILSVTFSH